MFNLHFAISFPKQFVANVLSNAFCFILVLFSSIKNQWWIVIFFLLGLSKSIYSIDGDEVQAWHGMVATHNPFRPAQGCLLCQVSLSGRLPQRSQYEPILAIRHVAAPL